MAQASRRARGAAALSLAALAACTPAPDESRYGEMVDYLLAAGFMRTDCAPADAPFGNADLIRNFELIALATEYVPPEPDTAPGPPVQRRTPQDLRKWTGPVDWALVGDAATEADVEIMRRLGARLEPLTGLEFRETDYEHSTLDVYVMSPRERKAFARHLVDRGLAGRNRLELAWTRDPTLPCIGGLAYDDTGIRYVRVLIKEETAGPLREDCIHEEVVQSLGLTNDDAGVRPSVFNDDAEFARLTLHDEYLVRVLYDPRLSHGMSAAEAMPIVRRIVAEIGPDAVPPRFDPEAHAATGACGAPPQRAAVAGRGRRG